MEKKALKSILFSVGCLVMFAVWTVLVRIVDVKAIGPGGTSVGFAGLNEFVHNTTGVNMILYNVTDWLGLVPIAVALGFAMLGFIQLFARKSISKVDKSIIVLGLFYILVAMVYVFFEIYHINYRPVLIYGQIEASYPSSTTMLVMCVMPTASMQFRRRIKNCRLKQCISFLITAFTCFMVVARVLSGVHWITDIIGGIIVSLGLVKMYKFYEDKLYM